MIAENWEKNQPSRPMEIRVNQENEDYVIVVYHHDQETFFRKYTKFTYISSSKPNSLLSQFQNASNLVRFFNSPSNYEFFPL